MTGLVERVARAICNDGQLAHEPGYDQWELWLGEARAALRAILETHAVVPLEPTVEMRAAVPVAAYDLAQQHYRAMLAAAPDPLKE
jgi:hypothetical protein